MTTPGFAAGGSLSGVRAERSLVAVSEFRHQEGLIVPQISIPWWLKYLMKKVRGCCKERAVVRCFVRKPSWSQAKRCVKAHCRMSYCKGGESGRPW